MQAVLRGHDVHDAVREQLKVFQMPHEVSLTMTYKPVATNHVLTEDDKRFFITEGYVILPRLIPSGMVETALNVCYIAYCDENFTVYGSKESALPSFGPAQQH